MAKMPRELDVITTESNNAVDDFRKLDYFALVHVPAHKHGLVVGKGGSTIQSIENSSKAVMCCPIHPDKWLVIADDSHKIDRAKSLIANKISNRYY